MSPIVSVAVGYFFTATLYLSYWLIQRRRLLKLSQLVKDSKAN